MARAVSLNVPFAITAVCGALPTARMHKISLSVESPSCVARLHTLLNRVGTGEPRGCRRTSS